ncbi:MAG TPA: class I SAM-dependent methyltransferase [Nocardioidaceae bacterium]|nr:class I SAM-dependent methyltransferase [Nocardioidaceae bacterium]
MSSDLPARLREALVTSGFTYAAVAGLLGPRAHDALGRNETAPALRRTTGGSPLETLVRLFLLQRPVPLDAAEQALPGLVDRMAAEGIVERSVGEVAARLDCRPYAADDTELWVVSDLTPGLDGGPQRVAPEHVLGISAASTSLAQLTIREPVGAALDLGTGCGVQALHLAGHADRVVATDVNRRALDIARFNAALNELDAIDVRHGSYFEPMAGERYDLIATNPPFVISPATGERLVYRDSGLPGDEVVRRIVEAAPRHLNPGGWCQLVANWVHRETEPWQEHLADWLDDSGCDAWVVQREVTDPARYVELWLADAGLRSGPEYVARYDAWMSWFAEEGVEAIGLGWVNLRRAERDRPVARMEDWPYSVEQPIGPEVAAWGRRTDWLEDRLGPAGGLAGLDDVRLRVADDLVQETYGRPGEEDPERIVLRRQRGMRRARQVDTVEAGLVGACDGELTVGQILDALATLLDRDPAGLRRDYALAVGELVEEGLVEPVE